MHFCVLDSAGDGEVLCPQRTHADDMLMLSSHVCQLLQRVYLWRETNLSFIGLPEEIYTLLLDYWGWQLYSA